MSKAPTVDFKALLRALATAIGREDWTAARAEVRQIARHLPGNRAAKVTQDRVAWIQEQMAELTQLVEAAGVRDVQGQARLRAELRMLRDMLDAETKSRREAESGGSAAQLEAKLVEALAAIDEERLARVIRGAARARGIDDVGEWLQTAESAAS